MWDLPTLPIHIYPADTYPSNTYLVHRYILSPPIHTPPIHTYSTHTYPTDIYLFPWYTLTPPIHTYYTNTYLLHRYILTSAIHTHSTHTYLPQLHIITSAILQVLQCEMFPPQPVHITFRWADGNKISTTNFTLFRSAVSISVFSTYWRSLILYDTYLLVKGCLLYHLYLDVKSFGAEVMVVDSSRPLTEWRPLTG